MFEDGSKTYETFYEVMQALKQKNSPVETFIRLQPNSIPAKCNYPDADSFTVFENKTVHIVKGDLFN